MAKLRIDIDSRAFRQILTGPEVTSDISRRANAIAAAAGPGVTADVFVGGYGGGRTVAIIATATPEAIRAEATNRTLSQALDAGR